MRLYLKRKRIFDIILSLIAIILLSPIYFSVALAVKKISGSPIIFKQKRYGLNGKEIIERLSF